MPPTRPELHYQRTSHFAPPLPDQVTSSVFVKGGNMKAHIDPHRNRYFVFAALTACLAIGIGIAATIYGFLSANWWDIPLGVLVAITGMVAAKTCTNRSTNI